MNKTDEKGDPTPISPEEARWRASAYSPERLRESLKKNYILLGIWSVITAAWIIAVCLNTTWFSWWTLFVLTGTFLSIIINIVNVKRLLAGKKPF